MDDIKAQNLRNARKEMFLSIAHNDDPPSRSMAMGLLQAMTYDETPESIAALDALYAEHYKFLKDLDVVEEYKTGGCYVQYPPSEKEAIDHIKALISHIPPPDKASFWEKFAVCHEMVHGVFEGSRARHNQGDYRRIGFTVPFHGLVFETHDMKNSPMREFMMTFNRYPFGKG